METHSPLPPAPPHSSYRGKVPASMWRLKVQEPQSASRRPQRGSLLPRSMLPLGLRVSGSPWDPLKPCGSQNPSFILSTLRTVAVLLCPDLLPWGRWQGSQ